MADESEYLHLLDRAIELADRAKLRANASISNDERAATVLLVLMADYEAILQLISQTIPSRWRVN